MKLDDTLEQHALSAMVSNQGHVKSEEHGCRLEYNGRVFNKDGGACQGRCFCQHIHESHRARYGGRTYACSSPHLDDLPEENEDSGDVVY